MAVTDVPAFFNDFRNTEEGENPDRDFLQNLEGDAPNMKHPDPDAPKDDVQTEDKSTKTEPEENATQQEEKPEEGKGENDTAENSQGEQSGQPDTQTATKVPDQQPVDKKPTEKIFGKYDTMEEAEAAFRSMEEATQKVAERIANPDEEFLKEVDALTKRPLVNFTPPDYKDYFLQNGDFQMKEYLEDTLKGFAMEMQKSMLTGQLGAAQYGILSRAIRQQNEQLVTTTKQNQEADAMWSKLTDEIPLLKEQKWADIYEQTLLGAKIREKQKAEKEGKKPKNWGYDDYKAVAISLIGDNKGIQPTQPTQDPVEPMRGGAVLNAGKTAARTEDDEIMDDIDAMTRAKTRGQLF